MLDDIVIPKTWLDFHTAINIAEDACYGPMTSGMAVVLANVPEMACTVMGVSREVLERMVAGATDHEPKR